MDDNFLNFRKPPMIAHRGKRPENWRDAISLCSKNIRLNKRATKLLTYYAGCGYGFRPALALIVEEAGVARNKISTVRKELVNYGLIGYGDGFLGMLIIDWNHILRFALLDSPMKYDKKHISGVFDRVAVIEKED